MAPLQQTARITQKIPLTPHIYQFTFQTPKSVEFIPGQYVTVIINPTTRRQYSFASPLGDTFSFDLVIDVSPMGPGSNFFLTHGVGDPVDILAPLGTFHLADSSNKKVFVATGTGVMPFHSMIFSKSFSEKSTLYWGLRYEEDIYWQKEFEQFSSSHPNFQFILTLSRPTASWTGKQGHVEDHLFANEKNLQDADFYLCGSKIMITQMRDKLLAAGVPADQIKFELFY